MMSPIKTISCFLAIVCLLIVQTSSTNVQQKSYLIKGRKLDGLTDAATQLRQFLQSNLNANGRCKRFGIMLSDYKEKRSLGLFDLIEIATMDNKKAGQEFFGISVDQLRDFYIEALKSFLSAGRINAAFIELHNCLTSEYASQDAVARSFLNTPELKQIVSQYEAITSQPAGLFERHQHPTLRLEELHETIKNTVARWLPNGRAQLGELFASVAEQHQKPSPESPPQVNHVNERLEKKHPEVDVDQHNPNHQQQSQQVSEPDFSDLHRPVSAVGQMNEPEPQPMPADPQQMTEDELHYLGDVFDALIATYESLPVNTPANERCRAYSDLIEASSDQDKLYGDNFVGKLVSDVARRIPRANPNAPFVPNQHERGNFLFLLQLLHPDEQGLDVWLDMLSCVREWEYIDQDVGQFLNGQELAYILEQLQGNIDDSQAPAYA